MYLQNLDGGVCSGATFGFVIGLQGKIEWGLELGLDLMTILSTKRTVFKLLTVGPRCMSKAVEIQANLSLSHILRSSSSHEVK